MKIKNQNIATRALLLFVQDPKKEAANKSLSDNNKHSEKLIKALNEKILDTILSAKKKVNFDLIISTNPGAKQEFARQTFSQSRMVPLFIDQEEKDFGRNLEKSISSVFESGYKSVVVMGNDSPDINNEIIERSFNLLDDGKAYVIGPTEDGGIYLLGLKKLTNNLLKNISWQTSKVFKQIIENSSKHNESYQVLETLNDIDDSHSFRKWIKKGTIASKIIKIFLSNIDAGVSECYFFTPPFNKEEHSSKRLSQKSPPRTA